MGNPSLLMAMQNNTTTVEDSLAISYKTEHTLNISFSRLSNCNSLTKGVEKSSSSSSSSSSSYLHPESYTKICTQMFLSALFIVAKTWKQLGSFSVGERINKLWYTQAIYGEGNDNPLQYSCLENPMDGGAWWAIVHGVAKSQTRLNDFTFNFHSHALEKELATHSSFIAWRIPGTEEPVCGVAQGWTQLKQLSSSRQ